MGIEGAGQGGHEWGREGGGGGRMFRHGIMGGGGWMGQGVHELGREEVGQSVQAWEKKWCGSGCAGMGKRGRPRVCRYEEEREAQKISLHCPFNKTGMRKDKNCHGGQERQEAKRMGSKWKRWAIWIEITASIQNGQWAGRQEVIKICIAWESRILR
jgi:hypothetical protein